MAKRRLRPLSLNC